MRRMTAEKKHPITQEEANISPTIEDAERFLLTLPAQVLLEPLAHPLITTSYLLSAALHKHQKRAGGEPYFTHPLAVCRTLCEIDAGVDAEMIAAALLHDTVEDCGITTEEIAEKITGKVATMVDGLTKVNIENSTNGDAGKTFEKFLVFARKDPRLYFIKFSDLIHNLDTLQHLSEEKQERYAKGVLVKYAPLARSIKQDKIAEILERKAKKWVR